METMFLYTPICDLASATKKFVGDFHEIFRVGDNV
jgi:hypothetical protein